MSEANESPGDELDEILDEIRIPVAERTGDEVAEGLRRVLGQVNGQP